MKAGARDCEACRCDRRTETLQTLWKFLSDKARQPWDKIVQTQMTKCPWEDIFGVTHDETPTKNWDSFMECITFHLQQVFRHDAGESLKYYITNTLRKPNGVPIHQFWVLVE